MTRFQMLLRKLLNRPQTLPPAGKKSEHDGPQINGGPGPANEPQINPGPGAQTKVSPYDQPQINPGPGDGYFSRPQVLGLGARVERPYSSRPFGAAQDDTLF